jgi:hypothetical protein
MERKGILIVCEKGIKGGRNMETKRQAILEKKRKTCIPSQSKLALHP